MYLRLKEIFSVQQKIVYFLWRECHVLVKLAKTGVYQYSQHKYKVDDVLTYYFRNVTLQILQLSDFLLIKSTIYTVIVQTWLTA